MKDLLVVLVEYIFHVGADEEITLKKLAIIALKVLIFLLIISFALWVVLNLNK